MLNRSLAWLMLSCSRAEFMLDCSCDESMLTSSRAELMLDCRRAWLTINRGRDGLSSVDVQECVRWYIYRKFFKKKGWGAIIKLKYVCNSPP